MCNQFVLCFLFNLFVLILFFWCLIDYFFHFIFSCRIISIGHVCHICLFSFNLFFQLTWIFFHLSLLSQAILVVLSEDNRLDDCHDADNLLIRHVGCFHALLYFTFVEFKCTVSYCRKWSLFRWLNIVINFVKFTLYKNQEKPTRQNLVVGNLGSLHKVFFCFFMSLSVRENAFIPSRFSHLNMPLWFNVGMNAF